MVHIETSKESPSSTGKWQFAFCVVVVASNCKQLQALFVSGWFASLGTLQQFSLLFHYRDPIRRVIDFMIAGVSLTRMAGNDPVPYVSFTEGAAVKGLGDCDCLRQKKLVVVC